MIPDTIEETTEEKGVHDILRSMARALKLVHFPEKDKHGNPSITRFFLDNGRYPFVGDEIKPWYYKGWLLILVQENYHAMDKISAFRKSFADNNQPMPAIPEKLLPGAYCNRWDYYFRQIDAGGITDEPIPQIHFFSEGEQRTLKAVQPFQKIMEKVEYKASSWNVFGDVIDWLAFGLGVWDTPSRLPDAAQEILYREFDITDWLKLPCDYLGHIYAESKVNRHNKTGFYPTPSSVVECMVQMVMTDSEGRQAGKFDTVMDCCVGTGRMLLHASNYSLRLYGMDIDPLCVKICLINAALYAPWMAFPFPEEFFAEHDALKKEKQDAENAINGVCYIEPARTTDITSHALKASEPPRNESIQPNLLDMPTEQSAFQREKPKRAPKKIVLNEPDGENPQGSLF